MSVALDRPRTGLARTLAWRSTSPMRAASSRAVASVIAFLLAVSIATGAGGSNRSSERLDPTGALVGSGLGAGTPSEGADASEPSEAASAVEPGAARDPDLVASPEVLVDEVILTTGERLIGSITSEDDLSITLEHPLLGTLVVPRSGVASSARDVPRAPRRASIAPPRAEPVERAADEPDFAAAAVSPGSAPATAARAAQAEKPGAAAASPSPGGATAEEARPEPPHPLLDPDRWDYAVGVAFGVVNNRRSEVNARLTGSAEHRSDLARLRVDGVYFFNRSDEQVLDNDFRLASTQDWLLPESPLSIFARASWNWDEFESWQNRVSGFVGPGYELVDQEDLEVRLRLGAGVTREWGDVDRLTPEAIVAAEWNWEPAERHAVTGTLEWEPELERGGDYRVRLQTEWRMRLQDEDGVSLFLGVRDEFESRNDPEERNDFRLFGGVKYEF